MQTQVELPELEAVKEEYQEKDAIGIPMSVRERYERALADIRERIRQSRRGKSGKKLGELLIEQGVLDQAKLQQALTVQQHWGNGELLGEVLLTLRLIEREALLLALQMQTSNN